MQQGVVGSEKIFAIAINAEKDTMTNKENITGQPLSSVLEHLQNGEVIVMPILGLSKFLLSIPVKMRFSFVSTIEKNQVLIQKIDLDELNSKSDSGSNKTIEINLN